MFLPEFPLIKPEIAKVEEQENLIKNYYELIDEAITNIETIEL